MKHVEPFEFIPERQRDSENPVKFTLKPLDVRGRYEIKNEVYIQDEEPRIRWDGVVAASRYIAGWTGGDLAPYSKVRVRQIVDGETEVEDGWEFWLAAIAWRLLQKSDPSEDEAKKS